MKAEAVSVFERFLAKVAIDATSGCWTWSGSLSGDGYGFFWLAGGARMAHRVAYELWVGPVPGGLVIDHLCRNRACVNPDHMEVVTIGENTMRGEGWAPELAAKTHCPQGHEYTPENTYRAPKTQSRSCLTCKRGRTRAHYARSG